MTKHKRDEGHPGQEDLVPSGEGMAGDNVGTDTPDVTGQDGLKTIRPVDLSLHGDGISHWQDEPRPKKGGAKSRDG